MGEPISPNENIGYVTMEVASWVADSDIAASRRGEDYAQIDPGDTRVSSRANVRIQKRRQTTHPRRQTMDAKNTSRYLVSSFMTYFDLVIMFDDYRWKKITPI